MERIKLTRVTGFKGEGSIIRILDEKGLPFYQFKPSTGNARFNLPRGIWQVAEGKITPLAAPVKYESKPLKLPPPRVAIPKKIKLTFAPNPHKCTINLNKGTIVMDSGFLEAPKFIRVYILFHEIGHYYFKGEEGADRYAAEQMLKRGYNPSQIQQASSVTLSNSEHALLRKGKVLNYAKKTRQK